MSESQTQTQAQTSRDDHPDDFERELAELPPSAKLVYKILEYEGGQTQAQLAEQSRLPVRTVRYALRKLETIDAVDDRPNLEDARQSIYSTAAPDTPEVTADGA
ncbi:winged helix-turn-helix domain-containing protein [Natronorubrum sp. FCH18a]|uniref:winged helix-turn-helix domain-containing protein n=1 Tax=Natronorubrum sp. FCH18a TaxID=3447018 RepID=UPI003F5105D1